MNEPHDLDAPVPFYRANRDVVLPDLLSPEEVAAINAAIDVSREQTPTMWYWRKAANVNCNLLLTEPTHDRLIRHPAVLALLGLGGASFEGDFAYQIDPTGIQASFYGYTGIVVAALARYNPLAVVPVGFFIGGLLNAGFTLQGADFPAGLVGVMQGLILFCALGGEVLVRYRFRFGRGVRRAPDVPQVEAAS
jgi:hypothetical protein